MINYAIDEVRFQNFDRIWIRVETMTQVNRLLVNKLPKQKQDQLVVVPFEGQIFGERLLR